MRHDRIEQQLDLLLDKPRDATPEEVEEWHSTNLKWWADRQFKIIILASFVQLAALGYMFSVMFIAKQWV